MFFEKLKLLDKISYCQKYIYSFSIKKGIIFVNVILKITILVIKKKKDNNYYG